MLPILFKLIFPVAVIYLLVRMVLKTVRQIGQEFKMGQFPRSEDGKTKPTDQVIEICPDCGNVKAKHHRCLKPE